MSLIQLRKSIKKKLKKSLELVEEVGERDTFYRVFFDGN